MIIEKIYLSSNEIYEAYSRYATLGCRVSTLLPKKPLEENEILIAVERVGFDDFVKGCKELRCNLNFTRDNTLLVRCDKYGVTDTIDRIALNTQILSILEKDRMVENAEFSVIEANTSNALKGALLHDLRLCGLERYPVGLSGLGDKKIRSYVSGVFNIFLIKGKVDKDISTLGIALISREVNEDNTRDVDIALFHPLGLIALLDELDYKPNFIGDNLYVNMLINRQRENHAKRNKV